MEKDKLKLHFSDIRNISWLFSQASVVVRVPPKPLLGKEKTWQGQTLKSSNERCVNACYAEYL